MRAATSTLAVTGDAATLSAPPAGMPLGCVPRRALVRAAHLAGQCPVLLLVSAQVVEPAHSSQVSRTWQYETESQSECPAHAPGSLAHLLGHLLLTEFPIVPRTQSSQSSHWLLALQNNAPSH
jgi:hypothetical protein